jgi:hypothetical protein
MNDTTLKPHLKDMQKMYMALEESNDHARGLLLLAMLYGDRLTIRVAEMNVDRRDRKGELDRRLNELTGIVVSGFYYLLWTDTPPPSVFGGRSAREALKRWQEPLNERHTETLTRWIES